MLLSQWLSSVQSESDEQDTGTETNMFDKYGLINEFNTLHPQFSNFKIKTSSSVIITKSKSPEVELTKNYNY